MTAQSFRPGDETVLASDSPTSAFSAVFEDDGDCGYLHAWDRDLPESARVLDAVMIYDVGRLPEQVREREVDVEIVWSADGLKAGLRVGGGLQAVLDFEAGLYAVAIKRLQQALERDGDEGLCWFYLGASHLRLDQFPDALRCGYRAARCPG